MNFYRIEKIISFQYQTHLSEEVKKDIVSFLDQRIKNLQLIYLFGSEHTGDVHAFSDIDIAFVCAQQMSSINKFDIQEELAIKLKRDIDLVDLSQATDLLKMQVIFGENLFAINESFLFAFENRVMQDYYDLKEMLQPLYASIKENKSIYG